MLDFKKINKKQAMYAFGAFVVLVVIFKMVNQNKSVGIATFTKGVLRGPVGVIPTERFKVEPELTTVGSQASKITVTGTNLSSQRRGILSPMASIGMNESGSNKNIWAGLRGSNPRPVQESFGKDGPIWNASDIRPESGVRNRYL